MAGGRLRPSAFINSAAPPPPPPSGLLCKDGGWGRRRPVWKYVIFKKSACVHRCASPRDAREPRTAPRRAGAHGANRASPGVGANRGPGPRRGPAPLCARSGGGRSELVDEARARSPRAHARARAQPEKAGAARPARWAQLLPGAPPGARPLPGAARRPSPPAAPAAPRPTEGGALTQQPSRGTWTLSSFSLSPFL